MWNGQLHRNAELLNRAIWDYVRWKSVVDKWGWSTDGRTSHVLMNPSPRPIDHIGKRVISRYCCLSSTLGRSSIFFYYFYLCTRFFDGDKCKVTHAHRLSAYTKQRFAADFKKINAAALRQRAAMRWYITLHDLRSFTGRKNPARALLFRRLFIYLFFLSLECLFIVLRNRTNANVVVPPHNIFSHIVRHVVNNRRPRPSRA